MIMTGRKTKIRFDDNKIISIFSCNAGEYEWYAVSGIKNMDTLIIRYFD